MLKESLNVRDIRAVGGQSISNIWVTELHLILLHKPLVMRLRFGSTGSIS